MKTLRCARVATVLPWRTCKSGITSWRAAQCKTMCSCRNLLWSLGQNNGSECRKWAACATVLQELRGRAQARKSQRSRRVEILRLGPGVVSLRIFADKFSARARCSAAAEWGAFDANARRARANFQL